MRKLSIVMALASTALAAPAIAQPNTPYVGLEVGPTIVEHFQTNFVSSVIAINNGVDVRHHVGYDADLIGGYDFGPFRAEAELAYKHAGVREIGFAQQLQNVQTGGYFNADGHVSALSGMVNGLVNFGGGGGPAGYLGGGVGLASVKYDTAVVDSKSV